ncbi:MAG: Spy/CpxP family protein refolding chaperone [Candidatus Rokubacteria bacterium]|nr:Spy/CpxP family protein refolding chaperone [Candidatus Rokubacteria bacterium]
MRMRSKLTAGLVLLLAGAAPAAAQIMGGGGDHMGGSEMMGGRMTGMMDMMRGGMHGGATTADCPGMTAEAAAFSDERPWVSVALAHAKDLELTTDQVKGLTALREDFQKDAARIVGDIRTAESELGRLVARKPTDLQAAETKIRAITDLEAALRIARVKTLEKAGAFLTAEQQKKLGELGRHMGRMHGAGMAGMMGAAPSAAR